MSLGARLALLFAAVAAATAILVGAATYVTTDRQVTAEIDEFLEERSSEIVDGQRATPSERRDNGGKNNGGNRPDLTTETTPVIVAVTPDSEVQVLSDTGEVLSNTGVLLPVDDHDLELAVKNDPSVLRTVTVDEVDYRMITAHLSEGGAVQVARSLEESVSLLNVIQVRTLLVAGAVAVVAAIGGWIVAQRTTRPLRALTVAVADVAETRDFSTSVPVAGTDEVGQLADGFNHLLENLEQSQEQQRRLVQDAAHELRTPLTSVTANLDWLLRAAPDDPAVVSQTLAGVRREVGELNNLMAEIIELATESPESPELEPMDLAAAADGAIRRFVERTGRQVDVTTGEAVVSGNREALARAMTNLLSNAHKYSPVAAPIRVVVGPEGFFVEDAGPGIPASEQHLVFERFYRRDEDRSLPGSGLGLSIVADVVAHHDGEVVVGDSDLGGARVGFVLPTRSTSSESSATAADPAAPPTAATPPAAPSPAVAPHPTAPPPTTGAAPADESS